MERGGNTGEMKLRASLFLTVFVALFLSSASVIGADTTFVADGYAQKAHKAFEAHNYPQAGELYEKAYNINPIPVYLENALTAYLHHAFDLLNDKDYNSAIMYCQKALSLSPSSKEAKEILSDIYCSRGSGYYFRGKKDKARADLKKALEYSVLPEQREKPLELLAKIDGEINYNPAGSDTIEIPYAKPPNTELFSVLELLEMRIYGQPNSAYPIEERINKLETAIFKRNFDGYSLATRLENLKKVVLPEFAGGRG